MPESGHRCVYGGAAVEKLKAVFGAALRLLWFSPDPGWSGTVLSMVLMQLQDMADSLTLLPGKCMEAH